MRILGIDPGSLVTGYGIIDVRGRELRAVAFGTIVPPKQLPFLERLPHISRGISALLAQHAPDSVAVEDIFHAQNTRVALQLGHVRGAALLPILDRGVCLQTYAPRLVKQAVGGHGAAEKDRLCRMVGLLLRLPTTGMPLDASDALAVAICHAHASAFSSSIVAAARA